MTKDESLLMKGVAILLMLFLHLFNQMANIELCQNLVTIGGVPLVHILSRAASPVPFFVILSGYGLYKVRNRTNNNVWKRIWKL